jgi:hypothetical protein
MTGHQHSAALFVELSPFSARPTVVEWPVPPLPTAPPGLAPGPLSRRTARVFLGNVAACLLSRRLRNTV